MFVFNTYLEQCLKLQTTNPQRFARLHVATQRQVRRYAAAKAAHESAKPQRSVEEKVAFIAAHGLDAFLRSLEEGASK